MGRSKKKQQGKTMAEVGQSSENKQQELMESEKKQQDHKDDCDKVGTDGGEGDSFELYAEWAKHEKLLISHLSFRAEEQVDSAGAQPPPDVSILVPGCGKSKVSENLYDAGFKNIVNVESSKDFIGYMLKRNVRERPEMKWRVMDLNKMQFADGTFDAIVDKGGLDSLMEGFGTGLGYQYLSQVKRVLKTGGKYVCLTLAKRLILDLLIPMFRFGWETRVYAIGREASSRDPKLQTFMVVAEKMSSHELYRIKSFLEDITLEPNINQVVQARDLCEVLHREINIRLEYAKAADIFYSLEDLLVGAVGNLLQLVPGRRVKLTLARDDDAFPYKGVLLDAKEDSGPFTLPYAVFLVPQNQAHEWIYTSEEGQWKIVERSKASRLLVILLDSSNSELSMDDVKTDLSLMAKQLEPGDCGEGFQIPYLIAADRMNKQEIVYEGSSVLTGPIIVEDVIYEDTIDDDDDYKGCTFRRLVFKKTVNLVQSQALLSIKESNIISTDVGKDKEQQASKTKGKGKQRKSDSQSSTGPVKSGEVKVVHNHLISRYHSGIVFGIRLISSFLKVSTSALVKTVVIGLGGGLLPMFMKNYLPYLKIEVVELDRRLLNIAREYFGFSDDESLKVHFTNGLKFVKEKADGNSSSKIDILIVDVDSSDTRSALTSPPADFVDESFLLTVKDSLSEQGLFIINLVSRSSSAKNEVYSKLKNVFSCILSLEILKDIHEVLFALKTTDSPIKEDQLSEACNELAKSLERVKKRIQKNVDRSKSIKLQN